MLDDIFYTVHKEEAIPLVLISEQQWVSKQDNWSKLLENRFRIAEFAGKLGDFCVIYDASGAIKKVYIGSGDGNQEKALTQAVMKLPVASYLLHTEVDQNAAVMWGLAQYQFTKYKCPTTEPRTLILADDMIDKVMSLVDSVFLVRDLINTPTNDMGPEQLAEVLADLAKEYGASFTQWIGEDLLVHNFPAIHAVGRAAKQEPRLLSLTYGNEKNPLIALVGKGVCFDSGGLDIKPSSNMRLMKKDMGGAAQVIGLAKWIMANQLPVRLHVLIPAVENAIGPDAFRPGDVITMRNKKTVEVDNTDAEGRLVLADALVFACEDNPDLLVDFATLTGAARVAVGTEISAMFTNDDALAESIEKCAKNSSDPVWRLPLFDAYEEMLNSSIADMVNCSTSPFAGATTAGLFLQRFITPPVPWVHFDIMAWNERSKPGKPEGGEAMGIRAMADYLLSSFAG